jgi:hypothetical protein
MGAKNRFPQSVFCIHLDDEIQFLTVLCHDMNLPKKRRVNLMSKFYSNFIFAILFSLFVFGGLVHAQEEPSGAGEGRGSFLSSCGLLETGDGVIFKNARGKWVFKATLKVHANVASGTIRMMAKGGIGWKTIDYTNFAREEKIEIRFKARKPFIPDSGEIRCILDDGRDRMNIFHGTYLINFTVDTLDSTHIRINILTSRNTACAAYRISKKSGYEIIIQEPNTGAIMYTKRNAPFSRVFKRLPEEIEDVEEYFIQCDFEERLYFDPTAQ